MLSGAEVGSGVAVWRGSGSPASHVNNVGNGCTAVGDGLGLGVGVAPLARGAGLKLASAPSFGSPFEAGNPQGRVPGVGKRRAPSISIRSGLKKTTDPKGAVLALMSIAQNRIAGLYDGTQNLARVEPRRRLREDGDQGGIEIRSNAITNHIEE